MKTLISLIFLIGIWSIANGQFVPTGMAYQGRLTDASGNPSPDGTGYEIEVRLWTTATGGTTPIWAARYSGVPVKGGAFSLVLGAAGGVAIGGAIPDLTTVFTTTPTTYLGLTVTKGATGVAVSTTSEVLPRQQLFSSPYALMADSAAKVQADGVLSTSIKDGEVKTGDIALNAVTTPAIADGAITSSKLYSGAAASNLTQGSISPDRIASEYAVFEDRRPSGTSAGSAATGWVTRIIGSTPVAISGSSITLVDNSSFSLQPGTYFIEADCPTLQALNHQAAIFAASNLTTAVMLGTSSQARIDSASGPHFSTSNLRGYLTVTGSATTYVLRQYLPSGGELGRPIYQVSSGQQEVYSRIHILKVK